jgi:hypothetical protein
MLRRGLVREPLDSSKWHDLTAGDLDLVPVEFPDDEVIEALVVRGAVISQEPDRLLLADEEAANAVGAVVNTSGIATVSCCPAT